MRNKLSSTRVPDPVVSDVYDKKSYLNSMKYQGANYNLNQWSSALSLLITLSFFFANGFALLDEFLYGFQLNYTLHVICYFGILGVASYIINLPFSYYKIFYIEERFGFNNSSFYLFCTDQIKGTLFTSLIGAILLAILIWIYQSLTIDFWWVAWIVISSFSLFMTFFYSTLIVPLFNKQSPLSPGLLRNKIYKLADDLSFDLQSLYVLDGSKRSSKANAYFSGFGKKKRIVLYDTLIKDLEEEEILAVLAHEIGHYKKKHVLYNMILTIGLTGLMLYLLSYALNSPLLSGALGIEEPSFHIGLIVFSLLYQPISEFTGVGINYLSRKFEYQADHYAKTYVDGNHLINALKKLSRKSLSNLNPDSWYEFVHYSHPNLAKRIKAIML
jgi:STE24 endopeptidase